MAELDDILREFLVESREGLDQLEQDLLALEQHPDDPDRLASIFRCIHTIKGTCGFLALPKLEAVAHVGESVLSDLRDGRLHYNREVADTLLALGDSLRRMLAEIESTGHEGEGEWSPLTARLEALRGPRPQATARSVTPAGGAEARVESAVFGIADGNVRVDVGQLDKLTMLVGELVLARNQLLQHPALADDASLQATTQRLNLITTELQEGVMKTRMQPIGHVWAKLPRVVRDLAQLCGKQVRLEMVGNETDLDKALLEAIKDPLTHIVRNSVDHGIEMPAARTAAGKPAEGRLTLRAYHEGGQVIIEIVDDGAGVDSEKVRQVAVRRGVVTEAQAARLTDRELLSLLFAPGFSTADQVTNVSGRGVGMDVVRTNIEKIGGTIDLQSVAGEGTTLRLKIPLTLAIIPALIVATGEERYAIPQVNLLELVRLDADQARNAIEEIHGAPVYRLRGRLLPIVHLRNALGLAEARSASAGDSVILVVLRADDRQFGLVVDAVHDTEEIVVKPLGRLLQGLSEYAGATIMGDGRVALILDVIGLAEAAHVLGGPRDAAAGRARAPDERRADRHPLLVLGTGGTRRIAMPLAAVARLEQFAASMVEESGDRRVVQYRGGIMPLVDLSAWLGLAPVPASDLLNVVVYRRGQRSVGLQVHQIVDIVEHGIEAGDSTASRGTLGAVVVQGRVTDLLDLDALVRDAYPRMSDAAAGSAEAA